MKIRVIENKLIPFGHYTAITLWPWIFVKRMMAHTVSHESIHWWQQLEVLAAALALIGAAVALLPASPWWLCLAPAVYYLIYCAEWLVRLIIYRDGTEAYRNISHEQEAYMHEADTQYLARRKPFAWMGYLARKTYVRRRRPPKTET